jgi:predicted DNA-binding WGR domain protein
MARYFEYKDEKSNKFWEVSISGKKMTVRYGKIGVIGQTLAKEFASPKDATAEVEKAIAKKLKEGYVEGKN